jgi:hypothetical protein
MVCYAVAVARYAPARIPARLRVPSYAVWDTAVMILNVLAFVFIGLQLRPILEALDPAARLRYFTVAGAVLLTVILVRIVWVMAYALALQARIRRVGFFPPRPMTAPSLRGAVLVSWCGMRGIVTLAAALAPPPPGDDPVGREVSLARTRAFQARWPASTTTPRLPPHRCAKSSRPDWRACRAIAVQGRLESRTTAYAGGRLRPPAMLCWRCEPVETSATTRLTSSKKSSTGSR